MADGSLLMRWLLGGTELAEAASGGLSADALSLSLWGRGRARTRGGFTLQCACEVVATSWGPFHFLNGLLGRATEVEVEKETVDNVGERETLQSTERARRQEDPVEDGADAEVLPPGGGAEDQTPSDGSARSLAAVANAADEGQVQSQVLANGSTLEHTEQAGSREVTSTPDAGAGASEGWRELHGGPLHPEAERGSRDASDPLNQSGESAEVQEQEKQDGRTSLGAVSPEPHQEPAPGQTSEADVGSCTQGSVRAGPAGSEGPEGTVASRPPRGSGDSVSQDDRYVADVPREGDASSGCGLEAELTSQEGAEPREAPVQSAGQGGCRDEEEAEGAAFQNEKPTQTAVQTSPSSAAATHHVPGATDPHTADAQSKPPDAKEPGEDSRDPPGEGPDSPQKKTRNKKKKNKKKKSPAPAETGKGAEKELPSQSPDQSEVREEEPARPTDERAGAGTPQEAPGSPRRNSVAGSSESRDGPESASLEADGKLDPGAPGLPEGDALQAPGSRAGAGGSEGGGGTDGAHGDGAADGEGQGVRGVSDSLGPESDGLAPTEELGGPCSDGREEAGGQSEKDKSKEDCTLS